MADPPTGSVTNMSHIFYSATSGDQSIDQSDKFYEVRIRITIRRVLAIDIPAQTFAAEFFIEASWLSKEEGIYAADVKPDDANSNYEAGQMRIKGSDKNFFNPQLCFRNLVEWRGDGMSSWSAIYPTPEKKEAVVCFRVTGKAEFQEQMELENFPLDIQALSIKISSGFEAPANLVDALNVRTDPSYKRPSVRLVPNCSPKYRSIVNLKNFVLSNEYDLHPTMKMTQSVTDSTESASGVQYSVLDASVCVTRRAGFWVMNVVFPIFLITLTNAASYTVPPTEVADRCSISLTLMLTTVAYKYIIADKLPAISYLTLIDKYVLLCLCIQVMFVLWYAIVGGIVINAEKAGNSGDPMFDPYRYPLTSMFWSLVVWGGFHLIVGYKFMREQQTAYYEQNRGDEIHLYTRNLVDNITVEMFVDDYITATKFFTDNKSSLVRPLDLKAMRKTAMINIKRMNFRSWSVDAAKEQWLQSGQTTTCEAKSEFAVVSLWAHDAAFLRSFSRTMSDFMEFQGAKPALSIFRTDNAYHGSLEELLPSWIMFTMDRTIARNSSSIYESNNLGGSDKVFPEA